MNRSPSSEGSELNLPPGNRNDYIPGRIISMWRFDSLSGTGIDSPIPGRGRIDTPPPKSAT